MMRCLVVTLLIAAPALLPAPAGAQAPPELPRLETRPSFEYFVARNRLDRGGAASELDGVGGRVLWPLAAMDPLLSRVAVGGYLVHSARDGEDPDMWHYGVQADLRLSRSAFAGRVDPLVSLGVGAVRVKEPGTGEWIAPLRDPLAASTARVRTDPSLVPGIGARIHLLPGVGLRGDARMVVDFRDRASRSLEFSGGISISG
ncbi:MAG TPA: hypothetical protein VHG51_17840 [Longimicrobiaceae bacterium]|nr:hypothetical protein [Longimicrobiaceae bacterium]